MSTVIGATYAASNYDTDTIAKNTEIAYRTLENKTTRTHYSANTSFNSKINSKLFIKIGAMAEVMNLNLFYRSKEPNGTWNQIWDYNDYTTLE